jgi:hypothetical protein
VLDEGRDELVRLARGGLLLAPEVPEEERCEPCHEDAREDEHDDQAALDVRRLVHAGDAKAAPPTCASLESVSRLTPLFTRDGGWETEEAAFALCEMARRTSILQGG